MPKLKTVVPVVAMVVALLGNIAAFIGNYLGKETLELQRRQFNIASKEGEPRFDESYLIIHKIGWEKRRKISSTQDKIRYPYPIQGNELANQINSGKIPIDEEDWKSTKLLMQKYLDQIVKADTVPENDYSMECLQLIQNGKRNAIKIQLKADLSVFEGARELSSPYEGVGLPKGKEVVLELGSLDTGKGVLIPLSIEQTILWNKSDKYPRKITPHLVYTPKSLVYTDAITQEIHEYAIRATLEYPIYLEDGEEGLG